MFLMIDGLDGSGKSTNIDAIKEYLGASGNAIFDLRQYWIDNNRHPDIGELKAYDFIFSCEPTYAPMGRIVREELINSNKKYPAEAIAHSYSLDRLILYNNLIIPLLEQNKCIIQDRGVSTSLAYQPAHSKNLTIDDVVKLPGNNLALQYRPDHLILADISPEVAIDRIGGRTDKQDEAVFEKLELLQEINRVFNSAEYKQTFESRGTVLHSLSSEQKIDIMKQEAINLFKKLTNE